MSAVFKRGKAEMEANLTPMIDVVFLLIVFFVLVSQIVDVENVELALPAPKDALTEKPSEEHRIIINVEHDQHDTSTAVWYKIGTRRFSPDVEGVKAMVEFLASMYRQNPGIDINLRADKRTHYEWIDPAMHAVSLAASMVDNPDLVPRINLVVEQND